MEIRLITSKGELDDILKVLDSYTPENGKNWDTSRARRDFEEYFKMDNNPDRVFVGTIDSKIMSVIGYYQEAGDADDIYWLGWFYVHSDFQGNKYGSKLLDFVFTELKQKKAKKLFVNTSSNEFYEPAIDLYEDYGFTIEDEIKDYYEGGENKIILSREI